MKTIMKFQTMLKFHAFPINYLVLSIEMCVSEETYIDLSLTFTQLRVQKARVDALMLV